MEATLEEVEVAADDGESGHEVQARAAGDAGDRHKVLRLDHALELHSAAPPRTHLLQLEARGGGEDNATNVDALVLHAAHNRRSEGMLQTIIARHVNSHMHKDSGMTASIATGRQTT